MWLPLIVLPSLATVAVHSAATNKRHVLHERALPDTNSRWRRGAKVDGDAVIPLRIGLTQSRLEFGDEHVMAVSDPGSALYGKHWTADKVHSFFAPADNAVSEVTSWLTSHGIDAGEIVHSENKGWLAADIPASQAEELFSAVFYEHEHEDSGTLRVGCSEYFLPEAIRHHIDYITPGVKLSAPLKKRSLNPRAIQPRRGPAPYSQPPPGPAPCPPAAKSLPPDLQNCNVNITCATAEHRDKQKSFQVLTPTSSACIRALYHIPRAHINDSVNALGLFESGTYWDRADLDMFFKTFEPHIPVGTYPQTYSIDGGAIPNNCSLEVPCYESMFDLEIAYPLIYPQSIIVYQVDDLRQATAEFAGKIPGYLNTFLDAIDGSYCNYTAYGITGNSKEDAQYPDPRPGGYKGQLQCGVFEPTRVISISYGEAEANLPMNYTKRQCNEFMKLALQGVTVFTSSGDYGVASYPGDPATCPNGCLSGHGQKCTIFAPSSPGNCPYITSVGGTQVNANSTVNDPESVMQGLDDDPFFSSAGGFSNYFARPKWQEKAVSTYFAKHDPGYKYYEANTAATNIGVGGGLFNKAGRGYPDVSANGAAFLGYERGFFNTFYGTSLSSPLWAAVATLLNQERTAAGKGPIGFLNPVLYSHPWALMDVYNGSNPGCHSSGFKAVPGWDPVTGLGTPNYPELLKVFLSLP